jgi:hypothetical protein
MNFYWGETSHIECCSRKERSGIAWLVAGMWKLKEIRKTRVNVEAFYV